MLTPTGHPLGLRRPPGDRDMVVDYLTGGEC